MNDSTRRKKNEKAIVTKMRVDNLLPRQEIIDCLEYFARSYRPAVVRF